MLCPLAGYPIDENGARIVAGITTVLTLALAFLPRDLQIPLLALLVADFAPRSFSRPRWSPFSRLAQAFLRRLSVKPHKVDAGPKRFAARIGLGMLLAMLACALGGWQPPLVALTAALVLCAILESALGFCVGCWIWGKYWQFRHLGASKAG